MTNARRGRKGRKKKSMVVCVVLFHTTPQTRSTFFRNFSLEKFPILKNLISPQKNQMGVYFTHHTNQQNFLLCFIFHKNRDSIKRM